MGSSNWLPVFLFGGGWLAGWGIRASHAGRLRFQRSQDGCPPLPLGTQLCFVSTDRWHDLLS